MKNITTVLLLLIIVLIGCKKEEIEETTPNTIAEITFAGIWERSFEAGPGNSQTASYLVYQDSIRYKLTGIVGTADYVMLRDTFILAEDRFIGHTDVNQYYLLFAKNISTDSLAIYKQEVTSIAEGLSISLPSGTTTQNHGWNTFYK